MEFVNSNLDRLPLTFQRYLLKTQSSILAVHSTDEQIKIAQNTLEDIRTKKAKRLNVNTSKTIKCIPEEPLVATNVDNKLPKSNSEPQSMMNGRRRHLGTPTSSNVKIQNINNSSNGISNGSNSGKNVIKTPFEAHEKRQPMITPIQRTKKPTFKASDNIVLVKKPTMSHLPVSVLNI